MTATPSPTPLLEDPKCANYKYAKPSQNFGFSFIGGAIVGNCKLARLPALPPYTGSLNWGGEIWNQSAGQFLFPGHIKAFQNVSFPQAIGLGFQGRAFELLTIDGTGKDFSVMNFETINHSMVDPLSNPNPKHFDLILNNLNGVISTPGIDQLSLAFRLIGHAVLNPGTIHQQFVHR